MSMLKSNLLSYSVNTKSNVRSVHRVSDLLSATNPDFASDSDINVIVSRFLKTGLLPSLTTPPQFGDVTTVPVGTDALMAVRNAQLAFERLPLDLRKILDHNMANFEPWLRDPRNFDLAVKYGFLKPREVPKPGGGTPPPGAPVAQNNGVSTPPVAPPGPAKP